MKKVLLTLALAMGTFNAFAQAGLLDANGNAKKSQKPATAHKSAAQTTGTSTTSTFSGPFSFCGIGYKAPFEYAGHGSYGADFHFLKFKDSLFGMSMGLHGNWGLSSNGSAALSIGPNIGEHFNNGKIYLFMPAQVSFNIGDQFVAALSFDPTVAFKLSEKMGLFAGLYGAVPFIENAKFTVGFQVGIGFDF